MVLRTDYSTGDPNPADALNATNGVVNASAGTLEAINPGNRLTETNMNAQYLRTTATAAQLTATGPGSFTLPDGKEVIFLTLNASITVVMPTAPLGASVWLYLTQDGTIGGSTGGTRTVTWPSSVSWPTLGSAPVLSMNPGVTNAVLLVKVPSGWWGYPIQ